MLTDALLVVALPAPPRPAGGARREGGRPHAARWRTSSRTLARFYLHEFSDVRRHLPRRVRVEHRARVPEAPRRGQARDHHLRRHARLLPADGHGARGRARAGAGGGAALPSTCWSATRRGIWLPECGYLPGPRALPDGSGHPLQLPGVARPHGRAPAARATACCAPILSPGGDRLLRPRHGVVAPGLERGGRAIRATTTTASSTRTSAGSCPSSTSATSSTTGCARTSASSTTASRARSASPRSSPTCREWALEKAARPRRPLPERAAPSRSRWRPAAWTGRRSWSAPTTPSCSATGGSRARTSSNFLFRKMHFDQDVVQADHAVRVPELHPELRGRAAARCAPGEPRATPRSG